MKLTRTFSIYETSEVDGKVYSGTFVTKKLTLNDQSRMGVIKARRAGGFINDPSTGMGVDLETASVNTAIAHCEIALVTKPDWFDPETLMDLDILTQVYKEVAEFENSFRNRGAQGRERDPGGQTPSTSELEGEGGPTDGGASVVDRKVPTITQVG